MKSPSRSKGQGFDITNVPSALALANMAFSSSTIAVLFLAGDSLLEDSLRNFCELSIACEMCLA